MWDPIVGLRNWGPYGFNATTQRCGTEKDRDLLSRNMGLFGYFFLFHSVGCARYRQNRSNDWHVPFNYGGNPSSQYRIEVGRTATKSRDMTTFGKPSAWVGTCRIPSKHKIDKNIRENYPSHFGIMHNPALLGQWRFNSLHLDGHVGDRVYVDMYQGVGVWSAFAGGGQHGAIVGRRPYGYKFIQGGNGGGKYGVEPNPNVPRCFDEN
jgi:hypothetical protein